MSCCPTPPTSTTLFAAQPDGAVEVSVGIPSYTEIFSSDLYLDGGGSWTIYLSAQFDQTGSSSSGIGVVYLLVDSVPVGSVPVAFSNSYVISTAFTTHAGPHTIQLAGTKTSGGSFSVSNGLISGLAVLARLVPAACSPALVCKTPLSVSALGTIDQAVSIVIPADGSLVPILAVDLTVPTACPWNMIVTANIVTGSDTSAEGNFFFVVNPVINSDGLIVPDTGVTLPGSIECLNSPGTYALSSVGQSRGLDSQVFLALASTEASSPLNVTSAILTILAVQSSL